MKVDIEKLHDAKALINSINSAGIEEIEFYENGEKLYFSAELIEKWRFIGLNNTDFITTDYYLGTEIDQSS